MAHDYCPDALATGSCSKNGCSLKHNVKHCEVCNRWFMPQGWNGHVGGEKHKNKKKRAAAAQARASRSSNTSQAPTRPPTTRSRRNRTSGSRPVNRQPAHASAPQNRPPISPPHTPPPPEYVLCEICGARIHRDDVERHNQRDRRHLDMLRGLEVERELRAARSDKHGISVTHLEGIDFGIVEPNQTKALHRTIIVRGLDESPSISLTDLKVSSALFSDGADSSFKTRRSEREPGTITVTFEDRYDGVYRATLTLLFFDTSTNETFLILRDLQATVGIAEHHQRLQSDGPYAEHSRPTGRNNRARLRRVFNAPRPEGWIKMEYFMPLPKYEILAHLQEALNNRLNSGNIRTTFLPEHLNSGTYREHFQILLWIEEFYKRDDLLRKSELLMDIPVQRSGQYYSIETGALSRVADLTPLVEPSRRSSKKESINIGDRLLFSPVGSEDVSYEAVIHRINPTDILLRFSDKFNLYRHGTRFNLQLVLNRIPLRRAHLAISMDYPLDRILFPDPPTNLSIVDESEVDDDDIRQNVQSNIRSNIEQLRAVMKILTRPPGSPALLVFGPPGTGKTQTVVEAIRLLAQDPTARILACAPSNYAADTIASRSSLAEFGPEALFRLNAFSRPVKDLLRQSPQDRQLRDFCSINTADDDCEFFSVPPLSEIKQFRIIVCTAATAGILPNLGILRGHFDAIFLDEAGQLDEPHSLIPFRLLCNDNTNVVLAGDPQQLQPVIFSNIAKELGLKTSLLERLKNIDYSSFEGENTRFRDTPNVVMLRDNYRSHPSILGFPSQRFYGDRLRPHADPGIVDSLQNLDILPTRGCPIIFHGVRGVEQNEGHSPSFFNIAEASLVERYINELLGTRSVDISESVDIREEDIGIISPYNAQCTKIERLLSSHEGIRIGNVEQFQGQERLIIIISTVRSSDRGRLGFVADPRRLNVMITRARALLIVIGNPYVLSKDPIWNQFIMYVQSKGGYSSRGIPFIPPTNDEGSD